MGFVKAGQSAIQEKAGVSVLEITDIFDFAIAIECHLLQKS